MRASKRTRFANLRRCMCTAVADAACTCVTLRKHYVNNNRRAPCRPVEQRFDADCCRQPTRDESSYLSVRRTLFDASGPTKAMRHGCERETH